MPKWLVFGLAAPGDFVVAAPVAFDSDRVAIPAVLAVTGPLTHVAAAGGAMGRKQLVCGRAGLLPACGAGHLTALARESRARPLRLFKYPLSESLKPKNLTIDEGCPLCLNAWHTGREKGQ